MTDPTLAHQTFGLSGRALCLALFCKYVGLTLYGLVAVIVTVPTFVIVGSEAFSLAWAATLGTFALLATLGVARTWATGKYRLEEWTTAGFILTFCGYSFALVFRAISGDEGGLALAIIPLVVCILPTIRYYSLRIHGRLSRPKSAQAGR